jgi:AcrR family transcriptional regulator
MGRPRAGQALDTAQVIEAAALLCDRDGWDALNLHALAAELKVRAPSLYHHVDGLPGLRLALTRLARSELRERFLVAAAGRSGAEGLRALARAYRDFARERPGLYPTLLAASADSEAADAPSAMGVVDVIAAVLAPYALGATELIHAIRAIRAALHGFVSLEQARGFGLPQKIDDSYARLVEIVVAGIERSASA